MDFGDEAALRALIASTARRHGAERVLHLGAAALARPVAETAEALGLAATSARSVDVLSDPAALRALLRSNGLSTVRSVRAESAGRAVERAVEAGLPVVLRPASPGAGAGAELVRDEAALADWRCRAEPDGPYLVEEYLAGPQYGVETLTVDGAHHVLGIAARQSAGPPGTPAAGHLFPAPLPERDQRLIRCTVTALLDLAGYEFGPAHTTVVLTDHGPRVLGVRCRGGADRIPLLVEVATGFDPEAGLFEALAGRPVPPVRAQRYARVAFFRLPAGAPDPAADLARLRAVPHVHDLQAPPPPGRPGDDRGRVVVHAATPDEAAERVAAVLRELGAEPSPTDPRLMKGLVP
ncbi:acetyl-CoA carboxylase biotin carboxylase subunit family protein [Kitasatospora sp. NPDC059571]|uniref:ATP-grasp domain-containing protein n=1 Tax=Kitasatospora sp. NPDC059571 TaxID=3346871 RepID=UPI00368F0744